MGGEFAGKAVWITGGGSGIGRALALEFASQGAHVAVSGRRQERLEEVAAEIEAAGGKGLAVPCDVTSEEAIQAAVERVVEAFGKLDVAVANAGYAVSGRIQDLQADQLRRQLEVNVVGATMTAKHALPRLMETQGHVALVASVAGMIWYPGGGAYGASKFGLRAIGLTLSAELHGSGVSCTTIHPGFVASEINQIDNAGAFHPDRVDKRPSKLIWPTDKAARVMARAIGARKREYVFTAHGKFGAWMGRHMPGVVHFMVTRGGAKKAADSVAAAKNDAS